MTVVVGCVVLVEDVVLAGGLLGFQGWFQMRGWMTFRVRVEASMSRTGFAVSAAMVVAMVASGLWGTVFPTMEASTFMIF